MSGSAREQLMRLYQEQFPALCAHLSRVLGDRNQAQDLAQQAGLRLLELDCAQLRQIREPRAFLFQIGTNLARDCLRRRVTAAAGAQELQLRANTCEPGPELLTDQLQELERVRAAVAQLPPQARRVLLLARVEGLSQKAVASRLGIQPKTVENHLARALALLLKLLGKRDGQ